MILEPIGEGAQGRTFAGIDKRSPRGGERAVAIKRFEVRGATSWKDVELAEREARVLQSLSHPRLPRYIDHFEEGGALYLVMEKIEGESLGSVHKRGAVLGERDVWRLLQDASDVLDYLHGRAPPVIHRDLKPGNVIRRPDGSFAFVDFGAVRDKLRPKGGSTVVGTFGYMAPEQVQGRAMPASDVYAVGATAVAMLSGCEPEELPHRGLGIDVARALPGREARLVRVLERMLEPDPERRASRIAPLIARSDRPSTHHGRSRQTSRPDDDDAWRSDVGPRDAFDVDWAERYGRRVARRARRAARRVERAARRAADRRRGPRQIPWPVRLAFAVAITVGIVAVSIATQVVVPLVLRILSLFVARRTLVDAANATSRGGVAAVDGMQAIRRWAFGAADPFSEPRVRVDPGEAEKDDDDDEARDEDTDDEESEASARGPGRR